MFGKSEKYVGDLDLRNNPRTTSLEEGLSINTLDLRGRADWKVLPPKLTVRDSLLLSGTSIEELPEGLKHIPGSLWLSKCMRVLPDGLIVGDWLYMDDCTIETLPEGLIVGGDASMHYTHVGRLPEGMIVRGDLRLAGNRTSLPQKMIIGGNLDLSRTNILSVPKGVLVSGDLIESESPDRVNPSYDPSQPTRLENWRVIPWRPRGDRGPEGAGLYLLGELYNDRRWYDGKDRHYGLGGGLKVEGCNVRLAAHEPVLVLGEPNPSEEATLDPDNPLAQHLQRQNLFLESLTDRSALDFPGLWQQSFGKAG